MNSFERFSEKKLPARKYFFSSIEKGKIDNDGRSCKYLRLFDV